MHITCVFAASQDNRFNTTVVFGSRSFSLQQAQDVGRYDRRLVINLGQLFLFLKVGDVSKGKNVRGDNRLERGQRLDLTPFVENIGEVGKVTSVGRPTPGSRLTALLSHREEAARQRVTYH